MSQFERELERILQGEKAGVLNSIKTCSEIVRKNYLSILNRPFFVQRSPGSLGIDLLVARGDIVFLVEVKASKKDVINLGSQYHLRKQFETMREMGEKFGLLSLYAFRKKNYKGDSWRLFAVDSQGLEGRTKLLQSRLPKVGRTRNNVPILKFDKGMPLNEFIAYLCR